MRKLPALLSEHHPSPPRRRCFCSVAPCARSVSSFPRPFLPVIITTAITTTRYFTVQNPILDVSCRTPPLPPVLLVCLAWLCVPCCVLLSCGSIFSLFFCRPGTVAPSPQHLCQPSTAPSTVQCRAVE